ncbi:MAG TPA: threonine--tRNA ligase [Oligoflexus sp.]|uniref:threonine--tRNA ligase n=1 Tax=Oligoflexus sp. TaxID=1971216 RepID=UPI002D438DC8|nr:threonine--tRNA ligase [Oligoflexus sp.]HYX31753.1 threonine--tRNA ligase [Oligoflexus sp.]
MELQDNPKLYRIRHSLAHILAQAVLQKFPHVQLGFGPPTEHGFFYDFDFGAEPITEADLKDIEKAMKKIIGASQPFDYFEFDYDGAVDFLQKHRGELYKLENLKNLHDRGETKFTFYKTGPFLDVCEGPHVEKTSQLPPDAFKLDRIAGAYWLGDEKRKMLTRIYALAFENKAQLDDFLKRRKLAEEFDHKKLGNELDIYHYEDIVGKGLPLWMPNGTVIRDEIQRYAMDMEFRFGYSRVATPHITKGDLYVRSQHLESYKDSMFPPMVIEDEGQKTEYYLKPMNCPHHHLIYAARKRSYRELPLRLAEYGTCYRYEQSGEVSGLIRVRCMTMNDAHIYLRENQFEEEFGKLLQMYREFYTTFGLTNNFRSRLSIRSTENRSKYKGPDAMWEKAEKMLEKALIDAGMEYYRGEGEAAFYGPKIDFQFKNLMGREETVSTIQVDFLSPANFGLAYTDEHGQDQMPIILHRAPLSTHERFISFLLEYYGGAFPTWCAPVQVVVVPVNEDCHAYGRALVEELHSKMVRAEIDESDNSFNKKIRTHTMRKVPVQLIIGLKEVEQKQVTIRRYGIQEQKTEGRDEFIEQLLQEIKGRVMLREPMGSLL